MFKRFIVFILLLFLAIPALIVSADVIYEPRNDFYQQNRDKCVYLGRSFYANGDGGSVSVKNEPGDGRELESVKNGEVLEIEYSCLYESEYWGLVYESGWVKMDQLLVIYDYISFDEEHQGEFYQYNGDYAEIKKAGAALAWHWPGSGEPIWTIQDIDTESFYVSHAYKDKDGREWGFVTYFYGSRNIWVCISDPMNRNIPAFNPAPEPVFWKSDTTHKEIEESDKSKTSSYELNGSDNFTLWIIIGSVAALVIVTAVLIMIFWRPNKVKPGN